MLRCALVAVFALLCGLSSPARSAPPLTIFAAASTTDAVEAVIERYESLGGGPVRASFAASSTLAKQLAAGAPGAVYLSANEAWMDWLAARDGIIGDSRVDLLANDLVLIVPKGAEAPESLDGLSGYLDDGRLAMGDPTHVPAGRYARAALERLGLWQDLRRKAAFGSDVRAALALVGRGEAEAGIVYATDARISKDVRVAARFPADSHPPIRYLLALVSGRATPAARDFHAFLRGQEAAAVFRDHGFTVIAPKPAS